MIKSFSNTLTQKVFNGENLNKKERKQIGALNIEKTKARLRLLDEASEKDLLLIGVIHYHSLSGSCRYRIDADARKSKWRITFQWENEDMKDVELVKIEDTHQ